MWTFFLFFFFFFFGGGVTSALVLIKLGRKEKSSEIKNKKWMFLAPWLYHIICAVFFVFTSVRSLYGSTWLYISHERHCFVEVNNTHERVCVLCIQYANAFLVGCMGGLEEGCTLAVIVFFFFFSNTCCLVVVCRHQGYNCRNTIMCSL